MPTFLKGFVVNEICEQCGRLILNSEHQKGILLCRSCFLMRNKKDIKSHALKFLIIIFIMLLILTMEIK